jgi:hypothetical protein
MNDSEQGRPPDDVPGQLAPLLPRPIVPASLEARVERSLADAGLLQRASAPHRWRLPMITAVAAGVLCFLAGQWTGRYQRPESVSSAGSSMSAAAPRFVFLLYGPRNERSTSGDVEEHRRWARRLAVDGHSVSGEKLAAKELSLDSLATLRVPPDEILQGFFVISARSDAEALEIARSAPHARHGGRIVIRRIEPT